MGPPPDRRKRSDAALARPATGPIPGSAIRTKLTVSAGFDKGPRRAVLPLLRIGALFVAGSMVPGLDPSLAEPV